MASRNENRPLCDDPGDAMFASFALLASLAHAERPDAAAASEDLYGAFSTARPRSYLIASGLMGALALPEVGSDAAVKRNS